MTYYYSIVYPMVLTGFESQFGGACVYYAHIYHASAMKGRHKCVCYMLPFPRGLNIQSYSCYVSRTLWGGLVSFVFWEDIPITITIILSSVHCTNNCFTALTCNRKCSMHS